jgi:putative PIN family toxin of toxin-antitoxin system
MSKPFLVIDTNTFISAQLIDGSVSARAYEKALVIGRIAVSERVLTEYFEVLHRPKFDKYLSDQQRSEIIERLVDVAITLQPVESVTLCRDPEDNIFLELALAANAACLITGDPDLLVRHPFRNVPIMSAADFLQSFTG